MKKYLIAAAFILSAPQSLLAQAEAGAYYVILDNTTNACRVVLTNDLPKTPLPDLTLLPRQLSYQARSCLDLLMW
jgi:hypothetical protein